MIDILIDGAAFYQLVVAAAGGQAAIVDNGDTVGVSDRGDPLGDDYFGRCTAAPAKSRIELRLGFQVKGAGGIVKD